MKELGVICYFGMKKYCLYKGEVGKVAPNLLNRDFHSKTESEMGHGCDGIQPVRRKAVSVTDS